MSDDVDLIVIGGGPVGLYALYYAGQRSMSAKVLDALPELGGQLKHLYPDKVLRDVAGVPEKPAGELIGALEEQALQFGPEVCTGERVLGLRKSGSGFEVVTDKGRHSGKAVLIACGPAAAIPGAIFDVEPAEQRRRGLFIDIDSCEALADRVVLICGGKEEAVGWALEASTVAAGVTMVTHFDLFGGRDARFDMIQSSPVHIMIPYLLAEVHGKERVEAATISHCETGAPVRLKVDAVLMARGQLTNLEPMRAWGVELRELGVAVDRGMQTSQPGIFAAGDIAAYPGKVRSIIAGAGEAAVAVNNAKAFIDPGAKARPDYTAR